LDSSKGIEPEDIDIDHQGTGEGISQELELASMGAQFQSQYEGEFPDDLEKDMDALLSDEIAFEEKIAREKFRSVLSPRT